MIRFMLVVLAVIICGCAAQPSVPELDLTRAPPEIAAQYQTKHSPVEPGHTHDEAGHSTETSTLTSVDWRIFRSANRIDVDNLSAHTGETWQRDGKALFMRKLFHDDRKAIEYRMDDLAVLAMSPSWQKQALLINGDLLGQLKQIDERWVDGHPARIFRGSVNSQQLEVVWLVDVNLPQSIVRHHRDGHLIEQTTLLALQPLTGGQWVCRCGDDYEVIDYADLGDRERDQFVMRAQSQLPGGNIHRH